MRRAVTATLMAVVLFTPLFAEQPSPKGVEFFEQQIRPALVQRSYHYRSANAIGKDKLDGELLLNTRAGVREGRANGRSVSPGVLRARDMFQKTSVIWGGELDRTSDSPGGEFQGGLQYGASDEIGVNDLHITILRVLGLSQEELTYRFHERDVRLTPMAGRVINDILA